MLGIGNDLGLISWMFSSFHFIPPILLSLSLNKRAPEISCLTSFTLNKEYAKHPPCSWSCWNCSSGGTQQMMLPGLRRSRREGLAPSAAHTEACNLRPPLPTFPSHTRVCARAHTHTLTCRGFKWTQMAGTQGVGILEKCPGALWLLSSCSANQVPSRCLCCFLIGAHSRLGS